MSAIEEAILEICLEKNLTKKQLLKQLPWLKPVLNDWEKGEKSLD